MAAKAHVLRSLLVRRASQLRGEKRCSLCSCPLRGAGRDVLINTAHALRSALQRSCGRSPRLLRWQSARSSGGGFLGCGAWDCSGLC